MKSNKNKNKKMDKKKKIIIGIILLIVICGGIIAGLILFNNKKEQQAEEKAKNELLLKEDLNFEINSELTLLSLVSEDNKFKVLSDDELIDTSILGEKEITIKYEIEENEEEKIVTILIVDTEAPTIEFEKELSTNVGTKIDLLKGVKVSDNSKEELKANVEGDYDINKEGTYNLKYIAVDSSNNKKEEEFTLKVSKKSTTSSNDDKKTSNSSSNKTPNKTNSSGNNNLSDPSSQEYQERYAKATAILKKYQDMYFGKYSKTQESFSPEQYITIKTVKTPVKFHYEWFVNEQKWEFIDDSDYISNIEECKKIFPAPNRVGKEVTYEENGITYYTGEKTQTYRLYGYTVIYDDGWAYFS